MTFDRRSFLKTLLAAGAFRALPTGFVSSGLLSCGGDSSSGPRTIKRTVHVQLGGYTKLPGDLLASAVVRVGGVDTPLQAHDESTVETKLLGGPRVQDATHFAKDVSFSAQGAQYCLVVIHTPEGLAVPLQLSIHSPAEVLRATADSDIPTYLDWDETAVFCLLHHPALMSHDPDMAETIRTILLTQCPSFRALSNLIEDYGAVGLPEDVAQGKLGWINATYTLDGDGQRIPARDDEGNMILTPAGTPQYMYTWERTPDVEKLVVEVIAEAVTVLHNDDSFEGVKYSTPTGTTTTDTQESAVRLRSPLLSAEEESKAFIFEDEGKHICHREMHLESLGGNEFRLNVINRNALTTGVGFVAWDAGGKDITPTGPHDLGLANIVGICGATYYASLTNVVWGPTETEMHFTLPEGTARAQLFSVVVGFHGGANGLTVEHRKGLQRVHALISAVFDFGLPVFFLVHGWRAEKAKDYSEKHVREWSQEFVTKELPKDVIVEGLTDWGKGLPLTLVNGAGDPKAWASFGKDFFKTLFAGFLAWITKQIATLGAYGIAHLFIEMIKEFGTDAMKDAWKDAVPFIGWCSWWVGALQSAAQAVVGVVQMTQNEYITAHDVIPAHSVTFRLTPEQGSAYFPVGAVRCKGTITPSGRTAIEFESEFDAKLQIVNVVVERPVPLFGTLSGELKLLDRSGNVVGQKEFFDIANKTEVGVEQVIDLEVEGRAIPVTKNAKLVHVRRTAIQSGQRVWLETPVPPAAAALRCGDANSVCETYGITISQGLGLIGYSFKTAMPCGGNKLLNQMHELQVLSDNGSAVLRAPHCGDERPIAVVHAGIATNPSVALVPTPDGRTTGISYDVRSYRPGTDSLDDVIAGKTPYISYITGQNLLRARMHKDGTLIVLTETGVHCMATAPRLSAEFYPAGPRILARRGNRQGYLSNSPVAIAPARGESGYYVLDQGNAWVQKFNYDKAVVTSFADRGVLQLLQGGKRQYRDVEIDATGNVWVLWDDGATANIEVYDPQKPNVPIQTFSNVFIRAFALDLWNGVFTLNQQVIKSAYTEPTVSVWSVQ